jgi:hypothetical protein
MYSGLAVERMIRLMTQRGGFDTRSGNAHPFRLTPDNTAWRLGIAAIVLLLFL